MLKPLKFLVVASAIVISIQFPSESPVNTDSSVIYTWDCEFPVVKPEVITLTCADGGIYIDHIDWSAWGPDEATGQGIYNVNNCDPDCADGTFLTKLVDLQLSGQITDEGRTFLRQLKVSFPEGQTIPRQIGRTLSWDLSEFIFSQRMELATC